MKYFNIDLTPNAAYGWNALEAAMVPGFTRKLSTREMIDVLCVQCREAGMQPSFAPDLSGVVINTASKKFMERRGRHNITPSKRAVQYMEYCKGKEAV